MPSILWIEDDYFHVKGLLRPLEKQGFKVVIAQSAVEGYYKLQNWHDYEAVIIDLIMPLTEGRAEEVPEVVKKWKNEMYSGLGLLKWALREMKVTKPIIACSVTAEQPFADELLAMGVSKVLLKRGLLPDQVQVAVYEVLGR